jgi:hypothetical protein
MKSRWAEAELISLAFVPNTAASRWPLTRSSLTQFAVNKLKLETWDRGRPARNERAARKKSPRQKSLLLFLIPGATVWPIFGLPTQTSLCRIVFYVFDSFFKMLLIPNVTVEVIFDPKLSAAMKYFVGLMRSKRLKRV